MSMELLAFPYYDEFYSEQEANRARRSHLEDLFALFTWVAQIDAFQHWIYTNPRHSVAEREAYWLELDQDFGASLDWSGLDEERASQWQRQLHLYTAPLYYIEYAIAQLGALQVWRNSIEDPERAFEQYSAGLALGGSRPLPELFTTAGIQFDFSRNALEPLMEFVQQQIELF